MIAELEYFVLLQGSLPVLENPQSERVRTFVDYLQSQRTCHANIYILRYVNYRRESRVDSGSLARLET